MENIEILEELQDMGLCETSDAMCWLQDLYNHIEDNIKPLLRHGESNRVFFEVIKHLSKPDQSGKKHLPLTKKFCKISKIINSDEIVQSGFNNFDYPHLETSDNDASASSHSQDINCQNLLLGILSDGSVKSSLYLVDKSCRVICHLISVRPEYFNSIVLFCDWKLIPVRCKATKKCKGYIEPLSEPIILHQQSELTDIPCSLDSENITGLVVSISSHISFTNWGFVIRILPHGQEKCVENLRYVLVHGETMAFWSSCIFLGSEVKITGVQLKRIREGDLYFNLRIVSPNSRLFILKQVIPSAVSRDEVVKQINRGVKCFEDLILEQDREVCPAFVGEITGIISLEFGIYSLDNDNSMLFCSYLLSGADIGGGLRVGSTVLVQNAHACKVNGTTSLLCCTRSKIQVVYHSSTDSHWYPTFLAGNTLLRSILINKNCCKHPTYLLSIARLATELTENFSFLTTRSILPNHKFQVLPEESKNSNVLKNLLFKNQPEPEISKPKCRQGLLNEILSSPHSCIVQEAMKSESKTLRLVSPKELCELIIAKADASHELVKSDCFWCSYKFNDDDVKPKNHEGESWTDSLMLLGVLEGETTHGRLQITDDKGAIQCLIYAVKSEDKSDAPAIFPVCPNDIGALVRINSFSVIVEKKGELLSPSQQIIDSSSSRPYNYHFYILCDVNDVEVLRRSYDIIQSCCWKLGCCQHEREKDEAEEEAGPSKRIKSSLQANTSFAHMKECILFIKFIQVVERPSSQFTLVSLVISVTQESIVIPQVEVKFSGLMLKWKPFLSLHSLIKIIMPAPDFGKNMTANENWKIEHLHVIPETIQAPVEAATKKYRNMEIFTVEEVKAWKPAVRVRIRGKINSKLVFCDNDQMSHRDSSLHLKLDLVDEGQNQESEYISIFFGRIENEPALNGILPGSIVIFHSIRIIVSNRGFPYGKFDMDSLMVVERIAPAVKNSSKKRIEKPEQAGGACSMDVSSQVSPKAACMEKQDVPGCSTSSDIVPCADVIIENIDPGTLLKKDERKTASKSRKKYRITSEQEEGGSLPIRTVFGVYQSLMNNSQERNTMEVFAMELFPCLVLRVKIDKKVTNGHQNPGEISFYAKCVADDNTGRVILHFDSTSIDSFFCFIGVPSSLQNEIIDMFLWSKTSSIEFDCNLHDKNNLVLDFPDLVKLKDKEFTAHCIIITLCNNVKDSVMLLKQILVRKQIAATWKLSDEYSSIFVPSTVSVGSEDHDPYHSIALKTLHLNCIEVL